MGRNEQSNEMQRKKRMEEIENGALFYFAKFGLAGAKISDLAKYLGISQGLLYRYYPSKEELFKTCSKKWIEQRDQNLNGLVSSSKSAKEKIFFLTSYIKNSMIQDKRFASYFTIFENDSLISGVEEGTQFYSWSNHAILMLSEIIIQGQKEKEFHSGNPIQMAIGYWGLVFAFAHNYIACDSLENFDFNLLNRLLIKEI